MPRFFSSGRVPLTNPSTGLRVLRQPDLRPSLHSAPSGMPLSAGEVDFDDLQVHRTWRTYDPEKPGQVKYFMYELSQRNPGEAVATVFFKAVRLVRLTRVPRYLRQGTGASHVFEQQRDVLSALREQGVLFLNVIASSPALPLVFGYGVQAVGQTVEEAQFLADGSYEVLCRQLDGTYQQLFYSPLTVTEGELLARYQHEWDELAMARGRPKPTAGTLGGAAWQDGNRTESEATSNQLESFIRGMTGRSFLLSLVTVPLAPVQMTSAWRNLTQQLSKVRSDQQGTRGFTAGVSLPLSMGLASGDTSGTTHNTGTGQGVSQSDGTSLSQASGVSHTATDGVNQSVSDGVNSSHSTSMALGASQSAGTSSNNGVTTGVSSTHTDGQSATATQSSGQSVSIGSSHGLTNTQSYSQSNGVNQSQSLSQGQSAGQNWANSMGESTSSGVSGSSSYGQSLSNSLSQSINTGHSTSSGLSGGQSISSGSSTNAGAIGLSGGHSASSSQSAGLNQSSGNNVGMTLSGSGTQGTNVSQSQGTNQSSGANIGESYGGSLGTSSTASNSVGSSQTATAGQSLASADTQTQTQGASSGSSMANGLSASDAAGVSASQTSGTASNTGTGTSVTATSGDSTGASHTVGVGTSRSLADGTSQTATAGSSSSLTQQQSLSDAWSVAMSRAATTSTGFAVAPSLGVSVSKQTFDEGKRMLGDMLQAQAERYLEGVRSGAFLYQMFLTCPDRDTLLGAAGLLKSAFWGDSGAAMPQPFHVVGEMPDDERARLLVHAQAFTSYRRREPAAELIEPYLYSTYITPTEMSAFTHPPVTEALGLLAVHDSMPVLAMPSSRAERDLFLGHIVNGERGIVSDWRYGVDVDELVHTLICGHTGSGKTTTMMRLLSELARYQRTVVGEITPGQPVPTPRQVPASILGIDWMRNMRDLAGVVPADRFRFYSVANPELGRFRWNPLAVPADTMSPSEWLNSQADNFVAAMNLGEYGRSLLAEMLTELYTANRLQPYELRPAKVDPATGDVVEPAVVLPPLDAATLPEGAVRIAADGTRVANVFTCAALSRLVSIQHLATLVAAKVEELATPEGGRLYGTAMRDRLQSLWRRMQYFAPGGQFEGLLTCDSSLTVRTTLSVEDLINPDQGLVTILETDGLDLPNRRLILGSVILAVYRYGLHGGEGTFDQGGKGPGAHVILEEAHELFGERGEDEDGFSVATRTALYDSLFRRARALGLRLTAVVQNPGAIPEAITSQTSSVFVHNTKADADRKRVFSLLNWSNALSQQQREYRYLGEMPTGYCIVRMPARTSYLESAPVQVVADPPALSKVPDTYLKTLAVARGA